MSSTTYSERKKKWENKKKNKKTWINAFKAKAASCQLSEAFY